MPAAHLQELSDRDTPCEPVCILHQRIDGERRIREAFARADVLLTGSGLRKI